MSKRKKRLWIICIVALLLFCLYVGVPTIRPWRARWLLATALSDAQSVALEQYTLIGRKRSKVVASHNISPSDYSKLRRAFPYTIVYSISSKNCAFDPHHRVVITRGHGETFVCDICFTCDMYSMPAGDVDDMPSAWSITLRSLFRDAGISIEAPREVFLDNGRNR